MGKEYDEIMAIVDTRIELAQYPFRDATYNNPDYAEELGALNALKSLKATIKSAFIMRD